MQKKSVSEVKYVELVNEEVIRHPKYKDGTKVLKVNINKKSGFDFFADPLADRQEQEQVIIEAREFIDKKYSCKE